MEKNKLNEFEKAYKNNLSTLNLFFLFTLPLHFTFLIFYLKIFKTKHSVMVTFKRKLKKLVNQTHRFPCCIFFPRILLITC